jgi:serine/threonine protein kinase
VQSGDVGNLGPYRIVKELGRGGMGAVYLAVDTRLNRRLALKVMLPRFAANPEARERFVREARAAAQVAHDNVVTVYEADERNGVPYIAMQFLKGCPLDEYLTKHGTPTIPQIMRVAEEAAAGVAAAHACGLIHRDIKPANLWLEAPSGRVKVLDFGLARPVDSEVEITKSGDVVGTPAYMSPEQARGEKVDHRTDLFGLGAVLYRLCTGKLPFPGSSTMAVLAALGMKEPESVREQNPEVPEPLAALIHQLLAKNPDQRPATADDVVQRIRSIAGTTPPGNAVPGLPPAQGQPHVIYVPIQIAAQFEDNAFGDLSTPSQAASGEDHADTKPERTKSGQKGIGMIAGLMALLAVCVVAGVVIITGKDGSGTKPELSDPVMVTSKDKGGKTAAPVGPAGKLPVATDDPDRTAAEYVLTLGGSVRVNGGENWIKTLIGLPKDHFTLTGVGLDYLTTVTDDGLVVFQDCKGLTLLNLNETKVTDAGLAHFKGCKNLTSLGLRGLTQVTDAGLENFKECKDLTQLGFGWVSVTDEGLAHFKDCKDLSVLYLNDTKLTDDGLAAFKECKGLTVLTLNDTKVTDAGLAHLQGCKGLVSLQVANTAVTDTGLAYFKDCAGMKELNLHGTAVTGASLGTITGFASLGRLNVGKTKLTPEEVKKIATVLKKCRIEHESGLIRPKKK